MRRRISRRLLRALVPAMVGFGVTAGVVDVAGANDIRSSPSAPVPLLTPAGAAPASGPSSPASSSGSPGDRAVTQGTSPPPAPPVSALPEASDGLGGGSGQSFITSEDLTDRSTSSPATAPVRKPAVNDADLFAPINLAAGAAILAAIAAGWWLIRRTG